MHNHESVFIANKEYYNKAAKDYFKNESYAYTPKIRRSVKELLCTASEHAPSRNCFLDYGCGSGFLSSIVAENSIMVSGVGVDASESQTLLYNTNLAGTGFNAETGDIKKLKFSDDTFDMAGGYSVLHHLYDYYAVISEITRVLKGGGVLYIDFEPNRLFKKMFNIPILIRRQLFDRAPLGEELEAVAEYHNNFTPGICRKSLIDYLSKDYEIIETGNRIPDLAGMAIIKILSRLSFVFSPCFYIVAKKK